MDVTPPQSPGPVIVGVERNDRSRDALALGAALARTADAPLLVAAVYPGDARSAVIERSAHERALAEEAQATLERAAPLVNGVRAELRAVRSLFVAKALQGLAEAERALAIVVGPSHRGALGRIVLGSVGARLLQGAPCPVAIAPRGHWEVAAAGLHHLGVGYFDEPEARDALAAAVGLATRTAADVTVLGVAEPVTMTTSLPFGWHYAQLEEEARDRLELAVRGAVSAVAAPITVSGRVVDGYADDELARLSGEVDLLVCGSRGRGPIGSVMLGSVSAGVLRKARCPVLIVPRGARDGFAKLTPALVGGHV